MFVFSVKATGVSPTVLHNLNCALRQHGGHLKKGLNQILGAVNTQSRIQKYIMGRNIRVHNTTTTDYSDNGANTGGSCKDKWRRCAVSVPKVTGTNQRLYANSVMLLKASFI